MGNTSSQRKRSPMWLIVIGALLIAGGVILLGGRAIASLRAGAVSSEILSAINEQRSSRYTDAPVLDEYDKLRPSARRSEMMPSVEVDGVGYVGSLAIPVLDIELPVCAEISDELLQLSPCCYEGNYLTDDLIICGEGYGAHFGSISTVGIKDEVRLQAVDGVLHRYVVSNVENDRLEDIDAIIDDWDLSLFTFNGDGTVCVVRCVRV